MLGIQSLKGDVGKPAPYRKIETLVSQSQTVTWYAGKHPKRRCWAANPKPQNEMFASQAQAVKFKGVCWQIQTLNGDVATPNPKEDIGES